HDALSIWLADVRRSPGHVARDFGGVPRRIERVRIAPDRPQPLANFLAAQVLQVDAEAGPVGELAVVAALAGEVGENLDRVADVANQDERRPDVIGRQRAGILLGLLAGVAHQHVPAPMRAAAAAGWRGLESRKRFLAGAERDFLLAALLPALLGFEDE